VTKTQWRAEGLAIKARIARAVYETTWTLDHLQAFSAFAVGCYRLGAQVSR
jgi:hypothetical protein